MKRLTTYLLFGSLLCAPLSNCRSTLYNAAKEGDMATVQQELKSGTNANSGMANMGIFNILYLPIGTSALAVDLTNLALVIGTLGLYRHVYAAMADTNRPMLLQRMMARPLDAALDGGHYDIASLLREYGATSNYQKHYHGDYSTPPTKAPKLNTQSNAAAEATQDAPPMYEQPFAKEPQPTMIEAAHSISTH